MQNVNLIMQVHSAGKKTQKQLKINAVYNGVGNDVVNWAAVGSMAQLGHRLVAWGMRGKTKTRDVCRKGRRNAAVPQSTRAT